MNWEKLSSDTRGTVTPANAVSLAGGLATWAGIRSFENDQPIKAAILVGIGRTADLIDGQVARMTNTQSEVGEALDAILDKALLGRAMLALRRQNLLSNLEFTGLASQHALTSLAAVIAKARNKEIHTSTLGKRSMAIEWLGVSFGILARSNLAGGNPDHIKKLELAKKTALGTGILLGTLATAGYFKKN